MSNSNPQTKISEKSIIEALIIASPEPISDGKLSKIIGIDKNDIVSIVQQLNKEYKESERSFEIRKIAGGYVLYVRPDFSQWIVELSTRSDSELTRSMIEVAAIVAIKQPVTKSVIDKVRGVNSVGPLRQLLEEKLITIRSRAKSPGRPFLYSTTKKFLKIFGLSSESEIPTIEELGNLFERFDT